MKGYEEHTKNMPPERKSAILKYRQEMNSVYIHGKKQIFHQRNSLTLLGIWTSMVPICGPYKGINAKEKY